MTDTRKFSFQIQFKHGTETDRSLVDRVKRVIERGGGDVTAVSVGEEDGEPFVTIDAETKDAYAFWRGARSKLADGMQGKLLKGMIVVCEGDDGWKDYLLLHHFDKTQKTDELISPSP